MADDIESLCRCCLQKSTSQLYDAQLNHQVAISDEALVTLGEIMQQICVVSIEEGDGLPQGLCTACHHSLVAAYSLRLTALRADCELRSKLREQTEALTIPFDGASFEILNPGMVLVEEADESMPIKDEEDGAADEDVAAESGSDGLNEDEDDRTDSVAAEIACNLCNEPFLTRLGLRKHILRKHNIDEVDESGAAEKNESREFPCAECGQKFPKLSYLNRHRATSHGKGGLNFFCDVCGKGFEKMYNLNRHHTVHLDDTKPFPCAHCNIRFATELGLERHSVLHSSLVAEMTTVIRDRPTAFKCLVCAKSFPKQESLCAHMHQHRNDPAAEYKCAFCPKTFTRLDNLTRHAKSHDEMKSHRCNICGKTFALGNHLIDHIHRHRGLKPHVCTVCHKSFRQACTLKDHLRTHNGDAPYLCSECGKSFNNSSNLRQHQLRHSGTKAYACPQCPSRFVCRGSLKSHLETHLGLRPYACTVCASSFTKPYSLTKHMRIHTGERPYACDVCEMRFNSSDHVKRHMRTHTGEKPYKCKFCERAFAQSNDLVKHTRSHVGDNVYQCNQCPKAFRLQGELRLHIQEHFLESRSATEGVC